VARRGRGRRAEGGRWKIVASGGRKTGRKTPHPASPAAGRGGGLSDGIGAESMGSGRSRWDRGGSEVVATEKLVCTFGRGQFPFFAPFLGKAPKIMHIKTGSRTGQLPAPQSVPTLDVQTRALMGPSLSLRPRFRSFVSACMQRLEEVAQCLDGVPDFGPRRARSSRELPSIRALRVEDSRVAAAERRGYALLLRRFQNRGTVCARPPHSGSTELAEVRPLSRKGREEKES